MRIAMLLLLAVVLAGCRLLGDAPAGGTGGGSSSPRSPDEPVATVRGSPDGGPSEGDAARREEPNPDLVEERRAAVDHFRIGPDGRTVVVYWWGGTPGCFGLKQVIVDVQDATPIIGVVEGTLPQAVGQACTMEAVLKSAVVVLDKPILLDGSENEHPQGEPNLPPNPMQVEPQDGLLNEHPFAVTGYRMSSDGTQLEVHYVGGIERCYGLARATAQPTNAGPLRVTVEEGALPEVEGPCEDIGVAKVVVLTLDEPLILQAALDT